MTCAPTCCPPGACAASPASSNARCPTLRSRRALTATGPNRPSHPPKPSPSDEPDPRQTHNATALALVVQRLGAGAHGAPMLTHHGELFGTGPRSVVQVMPVRGEVLQLDHQVVRGDQGPELHRSP